MTSDSVPGEQPPGGGILVTIEISAELAREIDRFALERRQPRSEALVELLSRGVTTMPKGCVCGQIWHQQRRKRLPSEDP